MLALVSVAPHAVPVPSGGTNSLVADVTLPYSAPAAAVACAYRNSNSVTVARLMAGDFTART